MSEHKTSRLSGGVIAAVASAVIAVSSAAAWIAWNTNKPSTPPVTEAPPVTQPDTVTQQPDKPIQSNPSQDNPPQVGVEKTANIYLLKSTGNKIEIVPQSVKIKAGGDKPSQILEAAFTTLLSTTNIGDVSSTIPKGTKLITIKTENDGIYVNLSQEFISGGGSASMTGRIGQVVYTGTTLDENGKVFIQVDGKLLDVLGGEGLELEQPLTRESFIKNYPL
jgi:spore germination protein GerM